MRYVLLGLALAAGLCGAVPTSTAQDVRAVDSTFVRHDDNAWRYRRHNGRWWYWTPERRWVYWNGGRWNPHRGDVYVDRGFYGPRYRDRNWDGYRYGNRYRYRDGYRYYDGRYDRGYRDYYGPGIYIGRGGARFRF